MLNDNEYEQLYEGFSKETIQRYRREARQMYDPAIVEESERRVKKMSKEQWSAVRQQGDEITRRMASLMDRAVDDPQVQETVAGHYSWIKNFYDPTVEIYRGLDQLYTDNPEFRANYDRYRPGLADFMRKAMAYFVDHTLKA